MRALLDAGLPVSAVISNRADAEGLKLASARGIATAVVEHRRHATREAFVARFRERMLNIHPSLLPAFTGLDTHERALAAGVKVHGCTVHFVTAELDHGPIVAQAAVPVLPDDDAARLAARVLEQEHVIYPRAVRWFLDGRVTVRNGLVHIKGSDAQLVVAAR